MSYYPPPDNEDIEGILTATALIVIIMFVLLGAAWLVEAWRPLP